MVKPYAAEWAALLPAVNEMLTTLEMQTITQKSYPTVYLWKSGKRVPAYCDYMALKAEIKKREGQC